MNTANNYDQNSTGLNLELTIYRDLIQSAYLFKENFTKLADSLWIYTECGNVSDHFSLSDPANYTYTVKQFKAAFIKDYDPELSKHYMGKSFSKLTKAELFELLECQTYDKSEIAEFLQDNFDPLFETITTRGYCQGDYAKVIITPAFKQFLADNGKTFEQSKDSLQTEIDHLFWDAPIYGRLEIDGDDYFIDELLQDLYEYDKDKLIDTFMAAYGGNFTTDNQELIKEFLQENLPEYPDYN